MQQQLIAIAIIGFFIVRLLARKQKKQVNNSEFILWLVFWLLSATAVLFLKTIDSFVASLGFSGSGIEVLLYFAVVILFYLIFRLNIRFEKIEKNITKVVREIALNNKK